MNLHVAPQGGVGGRMVASGGGGSGSVMGSTVALSRQKQINTLMIFNQNVTELRPGIEYSVDFSVDADGRPPLPLSIKVYLSPGFPETERPTLRVEPSCLAHPWLDPATGTVVGAPGLINYTVHSDLGRVVQAVKRELERNPPRQQQQQQQPQTNGGLAAQPAPAPGSQYAGSAMVSPFQNRFHTHTMPPHVSRQPCPPAAAAAAASAATTGQQQQPVHRRQRPEQVFSSAIPGLSKLGEEELKELLKDDVAVREFCSKLDNPIMDEANKSLMAIREHVNAAVKGNTDLAAESSAIREGLSATVSENDSLRRETAELCSKVATLNATSSSFSGLCDRVISGTREAERESDAIAEEFLAGNRSAEDFTKRYMESRSRYHSLKTKSEKLRAGHTAGFAPF